MEKDKEDLGEAMEEASADGEVIQLGNKIRLTGFEGLESGFLTVIKKMVGNSVREMEEKFGEGTVELNLEKGKEYKLTLKASIGGGKEASALNKNLFFAINEVFAKVLKE